MAWCLLSSIQLLPGTHVALSPPVLAEVVGMAAVVVHGKCSCAASYDRWRSLTRGILQMCTTLYGACHVERRVQLARPAYAAFSNVSSAVCARSSATPAGSLSNVLGVSTAAPKGEIVPKWEWLWLRENQEVGMGLWSAAKRERARVGTRALS